MKTTGKVVELRGEEAVVETERLSACEGCHKMQEGQSCSVCSLMNGNRSLRTKAQNPIGAKVGDLVSVESETHRILGYAALVFLLPLVLAMAGWFFVGIWTGNALWKGSGALIGAALTFVGLRIFSKKLQKGTGVSVITEILDRKN